MARPGAGKAGRGSAGPLAAGSAAVVFGAATVVAGGRVLFGGGGEAAGAYVPFVVAFNFAAGFAYVAAGIGLALRRRWAARAAAAIAAATLLVFAAFGVHVALGGAHQARTVAAMALRSAFWLGLAALAPRWVAPR